MNKSFLVMSTFFLLLMISSIDSSILQKNNKIIQYPVLSESELMENGNNQSRQLITREASTIKQEGGIHNLEERRLGNCKISCASWTSPFACNNCDDCVWSTKYDSCVYLW